MTVLKVRLELGSGITRSFIRITLRASKSNYFFANPTQYCPSSNVKSRTPQIVAKSTQINAKNTSKNTSRKDSQIAKKHIYAGQNPGPKLPEKHFCKAIFRRPRNRSFCDTSHAKSPVLRYVNIFVGGLFFDFGIFVGIFVLRFVFFLWTILWAILRAVLWTFL